MKNVNYSDYGTRSEIPYFFFMGEVERKEVRKWFKESKLNKICGRTLGSQDLTLEDCIGLALKEINYDYYISVLEPSFDEQGKIFYEPGNKVAIDIALGDWCRRAREFYLTKSEHSEIANILEFYLFMAYRIANGYLEFERVCDEVAMRRYEYIQADLAIKYYKLHSTMQGFTFASPDFPFEVSGVREIGGFRDGIGNTRKLCKGIIGKHILPYGSYSVRMWDANYTLVGVHENTKNVMLAGYSTYTLCNADYIIPDTSGVLVIKEN